MLGIDYGNTNCSVAVMRLAGIEVIANEQGLRLTPAVVAFTEAEQLIGNVDGAKRGQKLKMIRLLQNERTKERKGKEDKRELTDFAERELALPAGKTHHLFVSHKKVRT